jgi:hypothetical protein
MVRQRVSIAVIFVAAVGLGGCGTMNTWLSDTLGDKVPQWAGGLPPDAPPREGDPRYAAYIEQVRSKALVDGVKPAVVTSAVATSTAAASASKPTVAVDRQKEDVSADKKATDDDSIASHFIY